MSWNPRGVVIFSPSGAFFPRLRSQSLPRVCVKTPAGTRSPPPAAWGHSRPRVASADLARDATTLVMQCISNPAMVRARSLSPLASRAPRRVSAPARRPSLGRVASSLAAPDANPPFAPSPQVGLPDDEIHRRIRVHRGVYGVHGDVTPDEHTLFHLCPARWFHGQLPIGSGRHGFLSVDLLILGALETFPFPEFLLAHANAQLWEQPGYFYVIQIDPTRLPDVEGFEAADEGRGGKVLVRGAVDAEAVRRVFVAEREADDSMRGKFTNVSPP